MNKSTMKSRLKHFPLDDGVAPGQNQGLGEPSGGQWRFEDVRSRETPSV